MKLCFVLLFLSLGGGCCKNDWQYWNKEHARELNQMIRRAKRDPESYAVFDADNTIWQNDLEESLLPFLEMKGVLTRETIDPSLIIVPFIEEESLFAYYFRLCEIDDKVCFPWIAQVFSGFDLNTLAGYVHELFAYNDPIPATYWNEGKLEDYSVDPPKIYEAQRELVTRLQDEGIKVYIMTAAAEELARVVATDERYGLNFPPERIIGVTMMLRNEDTKVLTTSRRQISHGHYFDDVYTKEQHMASTLTPYLWTPATWYVGKQAAIMDYIHPVKRPCLVAGDSPNDHYMLLYSGGHRIWVARKEKYTNKTIEAIHLRQKQEKDEKEFKEGRRVDNNWIFAEPQYLHGGENTIKIKV